MLITDSFILLNYPKTGSSFARAAIKELYSRRNYGKAYYRKLTDRVGLTSKPFLKELKLNNIHSGGGEKYRDQHGCYCQIPNRYKNREIVTIVRNPYDRFLSAYEFRWWVKYPPVSDFILTKYFPSFPNLSLDDYVRLNKYAVMENRVGSQTDQVKMGNQTRQFIWMFFRKPEAVLGDISEKYMHSDKIYDDLAPLTFLRQEYLNQDLADFLFRKEFSLAEADLVRSREKINVTKNKAPKRASLWTDSALEYVRNYESMIFRILSKNGIFYEKPTYM